MSNVYYGVEPYTGKIICHEGRKGMKWGYTDLGHKLVDAGRRAISTVRNTVARGIDYGRYDSDFNERRGSGIRRKLSRFVGDNNFDKEQDVIDKYNSFARTNLKNKENDPAYTYKKMVLVGDKPLKGRPKNGKGKKYKSFKLVTVYDKERARRDSSDEAKSEFHKKRTPLDEYIIAQRLFK